MPSFVERRSGIGRLADLLKQLLSILFVLTSGISQVCLAQSQNNHLIENIFKLTDFIDWPEPAFENSAPRFNFCVLNAGSKFSQADLASVPRERFGYPVEFIDVNLVDEAGKCHILYFRYPEGLNAFMLANAGRHTLTVSDHSGFTEQGGAVGLLEADGQIELSVNLRTTLRAGLYVRSNLLQIARIVNDGEPAVSTHAIAKAGAAANREDPAGPPVGASLVPVVRIAPTYPRQALKRRIEGYVEARILVDPRGRVQEVVVLSSKPGSIFNREAIKALKKWKFEAASDGNYLVARNITQLIRFKLRK